MFWLYTDLNKPSLCALCAVLLHVLILKRLGIILVCLSSEINAKVQWNTPLTFTFSLESLTGLARRTIAQHNGMRREIGREQSHSDLMGKKNKKITCRGVDLAKFADWTVTAGGNEVQVDSLTFVCEAKAAQEQQTVVQSGEQREAAAERVVPEEELEHGGLLVPAGPPVRVGHGELVQVGEQRGGPLPDRPLHNPACAAGRRCHVIQVLVPGSLMPRSLGLAVLQTTAESRRYRGNNRAETHRQAGRGRPPCVRTHRAALHFIRWWPEAPRSQIHLKKKIIYTFLKMTSSLITSVQVSVAPQGFQRLGFHQTSCLEPFSSAVKLKTRTVLWTMKLHLTFHQHGGEEIMTESSLCVCVNSYLMWKPLWVLDLGSEDVLGQWGRFEWRFSHYLFTPMLMKGQVRVSQSTKQLWSFTAKHKMDNEHTAHPV